ncbi:MAG TPA: AAA family ATPase [Thermoanaerobaculia bacterium]|jgi:hypothetical protein|nr:AAA family ATPase [Thermoanaerobaculia bacterium]
MSTELQHPRPGDDEIARLEREAIENEPPSALPVQPDEIPEELRLLPNWVLWKSVQREGKWTKPPFTLAGTHASSTDPNTWTTFETVIAKLSDGPFGESANGFAGISFALTRESGLVGFDLDHCRDPRTGEVESWAIDIVAEINSYTEVSPSAKGLRIIAFGTIPGARRRNGPIEIYDSGRFLTFTGHHVSGTPKQVCQRDAEIAAVCERVFAPPPAEPKPENSRTESAPLIQPGNGNSKFDRLIAGKWEGLYPSQSEADLALVAMLAKTSRDAATLDRLFRASALYRAKWDERHGAQTYGQATIAKALVSEGRLGPLLSRSLDDLARNPPPPIRFVVENLLPEAVLALLFGKAFGGKSILSLQFGLHGAAALDFLKTFRFPRPLRALYVDEEMGLPLLLSRIDKMKSGRPEFRDPDVLKRFRVVSRAGLRLDEKKKLDALRREIGEFPGGPPDLTFADTLRRLHRAEEKDSGEMARVMETGVLIAEEFRTVFVAIHHSKKGPNDEESDWREAARGSGDLVAASQTVIGLWKSAELLFSMRADTKAAGEIQPFPLLLDGGTLLYSRQSEEERLAAKEKQQTDALAQAKAEVHKLLWKLKERGDENYPPSKTFIKENAGVNASTARRAVDELVRDGELVEAERTGRGGGSVYCYPGDDPQTRSENPVPSEEE